MGFNVAIDGPSGAGKSTLAKAAAQKLDFIFIDTGALYRAIGLYVYRNGINADDSEAVCAILDRVSIELRFVDGQQHVYMNDEDVSEDIRIHAVSDYTSKVSAIPEVREYLLGLQRSIAEKNDIIMDGRDIGTVVLPDADLKIYLTASAEIRAQRRYRELAAKGENVSYKKVLDDVIERDYRDMNRDTAPLKIANGAVIVDTTENTFDQSLDALIKVIKEHLG